MTVSFTYQRGRVSRLGPSNRLPELLPKVVDESPGVELWRGGRRIGELQLAGGFNPNTGASVRSITPFLPRSDRKGVVVLVAGAAYASVGAV